MRGVKKNEKRSEQLCSSSKKGVMIGKQREERRAILYVGMEMMKDDGDVLTHTFCVPRDPLELSIAAHQLIPAPFYKLPREDILQ